MMYQRGSFQVPVSNGTAAMCDEKGHSALDARGNCLCCGRHVDASAEHPLELLARRRDEDELRQRRGGRALEPFGEYGQLPQYAELSGGPEDGEIINLSHFSFIDMDDDIIVAGHLYVAVEVEKGLLRMSYDGPVAE